MKIGFLSIFNFGSNIGGVENHIYFLSQELIKIGHTVLIFQPIEKEKLINKENEKIIDNIRIIYIPVKLPYIVKKIQKYSGGKLFGFLTAFLKKVSFVFAYKKIANVIIQQKCDLVHQHDLSSNIFTTKYLKKIGLPIVLTNHTGEYLFFQKKIIGRWMLKYLLNHYDAIIGPSKELTPLKYNKNSVSIYNGADLNKFYPYSVDKKKYFKKNYGLDENDFIILCPRRWAPTKGVIYLVESIIKNQYPQNYKFLFAGSDYDGYPKYSEEINRMIRKSNKKGQIIKLGNLSTSKMADVYNISDIIIIPSLMEAVSLAAVESMATGTPIIATNVGGMPEIIEHNVNGILIEPADHYAIYISIMELSKNKKRYKEISLESLKTAKNFSWKSITILTNNVYNLVRKI